jgi:hypothetical protein
MDPTVRGLAPDEKHKRAHELATQLLRALRRCSAENPLVVDSERLLAGHERTKQPLAAAESDLDVFDRLFAAREGICSAGVELPRAVEILGTHLSR